MKKNIVLIVAVVLALGFTACNQTKTSDVPQKVKDAFAEKFADANSIKWDMEEENEWEAEFKMNGHEMSANFDTDGNWLETEIDIEKGNIPAAVMNAFNKQFEGFDIEEAANVSTPKFNDCYEMDIEKGDTKMEVLYDAIGKLMHKENANEDDEQGEQQDKAEKNEGSESPEITLSETVKNAFSQKFAEATSVEWGMENANEWEAEFEMNGKKMSANFDTEGNWKETEYVISQDEMPAEVQATLDKDYADYQLVIAEVSETAEGSVYEIVVEKDNQKTEVVISPDGQIVKIETAGEEDEQGEQNENNEEND